VLRSFFVFVGPAGSGLLACVLKRISAFCVLQWQFACLHVAFCISAISALSAFLIKHLHFEQAFAFYA